MVQYSTVQYVFTEARYSANVAADRPVNFANKKALFFPANGGYYILCLLCAEQFTLRADTLRPKEHVQRRPAVFDREKLYCYFLLYGIASANEAFWLFLDRLVLVNVLQNECRYTCVRTNLVRAR